MKIFPEKIELAFPKVESIDDDNDGEYISKGPSKKLMNYFSTSRDELIEWFRNYQVESIEVWISSRIVESNGIAGLVFSANGSLFHIKYLIELYSNFCII